MLREKEQSAERIKQKIDANKEKLKFLNSFYLPLLSGMTTLIIMNDKMPWLFKFGWISAGCLALYLLSEQKNEVSDIIDSLIEQL